MGFFAWSLHMVVEIQSCQLVPHHIAIICESYPFGAVAQQTMRVEVLQPPCGSCSGVVLEGVEPIPVDYELSVRITILAL